MIDLSVVKRLAAQVGVRFCAGFVDADEAAILRLAQAVEIHAREEMAQDFDEVAAELLCRP